ncbi:response regulator transcription factor [Undibacterium sp. FT79W]|uniref:LytR/AlgR family response regulator transcription factor n=1 Tax=unclassified Undibacterium TaxID=2630295 RepID=UPI00164BEB6F|nr:MULTISPECIES: LytTR family DNA-binding domain-containing protein [unclassified Undibacterium]MBC3877138.1 response regulator transcription factor [Undibacterium sp. FT79W]MBK1891453.1 response regulator transcription factor [Undibacterium sp. 14-3-2]MBY0570491.1 LytTR family DNA-binding domain-containing protein [Burkholderiaceae bacterium]
MPTAILADDERLMREQLRSRLEQVWPELQILDEAKNGEEAIQLVEKHQPDLIFLDIRMPIKTGLEAAKEIGNKAHIVFITAYDQYAIQAFDHGAVDYVLKPADVERLSKTVERLKSRLKAHDQPADMSNMLSQLAKQMGMSKPNYLQWIQASIGQELRLIPVEEILFFQSDEKYTRVQTANYEALIRKPVRDLSEELDPALFWQIHRSTLVNAKAISGVVRDLRGRHLVQVKGLTEKLEVSRSFVHLFKQM